MIEILMIGKDGNKITTNFSTRMQSSEFFFLFYLARAYPIPPPHNGFIGYIYY